MKPLTGLALAMGLASLAACERSVPMASLADECSGRRVVIARNNTPRNVEVFARLDTLAARSLGFLPPDSTIEFGVPPGTTGVFMFPILENGKQAQPNVRFRYRCDRGKAGGTNA